MKKSIPLAVCLFLALCSTASAAGRHTLISKHYGFAVQYPSTWTAIQGDQPGAWRIVPTGHAAPYAFGISVLPIKPARTSRELFQRVVQFERASGNPQVAGIHWSALSLAGGPAIEGVLRLSTEGGAPVTNGYCMVASRSRVFELDLSYIGSKRPTSLAQFPSVYRGILASWRFVR